jgi:hypothetical protein
MAASEAPKSPAPVIRSLLLRKTGLLFHPQKYSRDWSVEEIEFLDVGDIVNSKLLSAWIVIHECIAPDVLGFDWFIRQFENGSSDIPLNLSLNQRPLILPRFIRCLILAEMCRDERQRRSGSQFPQGEIPDIHNIGELLSLSCEVSWANGDKRGVNKSEKSR